MQHSFFPKRAIIEYPKTEPSADSLGEVEAEDYQRYYIKDDVCGRPVRASEWISTHLAEMVNIASPTPAIIQKMNGDLVFGSRRISGAAASAVTASIITQATITNMSSALPSFGNFFSATYAFDMFLYNDDRHYGNYLSTDDNGTTRFYAFDYSRALFWAWPFNGFPPELSNTRLHGQALIGLHGFDPGSATSVLDKIDSLTDANLQGIIRSMPAAWLSSSLQSDLVDWWTNGGRKKRLDDIRSGIGNGTLI